MKRFLNYKFVLVLIFLLGVFLRVYSLGNVPNGFHADEAAHGYNAYSILKTGKDEYGKFFPMVLKSFGDYKGVLYAYSIIPSISLFDLTPFAVRLPSAIISSLSIILAYLFIYKLLGNRKIALITAALFAISPWDIMISRVTGDVEIGMFLTLLSAYGLLFFREKKNIFWFIIPLLASFLAIISYAPYRIYVFLVPIIFLITSLKFVKRKIIFDRTLLLFAISIFILGFLYNILASTTRFNQVSIFSNPRTELILQEQLREDLGNPILLSRVFHNKVVNYTRTILENAGEYFTFNYLFLHGGFPQREKVPNAGLFYIWQLPFLLAGIYVIIRRKKRNEIFLLFWWILFLSPTFFTFDEIPNVHRNLIIVPAIIAIISIGIYETFTFRGIRNFVKPLLVLISIFILFEFLYFSHQYFIHYDKHQPWYRGYAYRGLVSSLEKYQSSYKKIVVTKGNQSPYIYILFYSQYDPRKYQNEGSPRDLDYSGFDKYYFVPQGCPPIVKKEDENKLIGEAGVLYVDLGECRVPKHAKLIDTIYWGDNTPAFKLITYPAN